MGAHPEILRRLTETNFEALAGYGFDKYCDSAKERIKAACSCPDGDVWLIAGGTQTNAIVISSMLERYEGVISTVTGHIGFHEAGSIEYTGHKVFLLPHHNGKLDADELDGFIRDFYADDNHEHMVFPGMVYVSHPTEYGTLYTKDELTRISDICRKNNIPLFLDGARLGYGLMSRNTDLTLPEIAKLCDVFYIGGTKVGALCGEAVVFTKNNTPKHFMTSIKQHGGLLAKGRLLGVQFDTLFTDGLYFEISKNAIDKAEALKKLLIERGYRFHLDSPTNQQFIIVENGKLEELKKNVAVGFWEKYDDSHTVVRLATSWATTDADIEELAKYL